MPFKPDSNSETLRRADIRNAVSAHPHVEQLAEKLDAAHLLAEKSPSTINKSASHAARDALTNAVGTLVPQEV